MYRALGESPTTTVNSFKVFTFPEVVEPVAKDDGAAESKDASCSGCWGDFKAITASSEKELYDYFVGLKADAEAKTDVELTKFVPTKYSSQVVAGMKYEVVVEINDNKDVI